MSARDLEDFISVIETAEKISRSSTALSTIESCYPGRSSVSGSWPTSGPTAAQGTAVSSGTRSSWSSSRGSGSGSEVSSHATSVESVQTVRESAQTHGARRDWDWDRMPWQRVHPPHHPRVVARDLSPAVPSPSSPQVTRKSVSKPPRRASCWDSPTTPRSSPERGQPKSSRNRGMSRQKTVWPSSAASDHSPVQSESASSPSSPVKTGSSGARTLPANASPTRPAISEDRANSMKVDIETAVSSMDPPDPSTTHPSPGRGPHKSPVGSCDSSTPSPHKSSTGSLQLSKSSTPPKSSVGSSQHSPWISPSKSASHRSPVSTSRKSSMGSWPQSPSNSPKSLAGSCHPGSKIASRMSSVASRQGSTKSPSLSESSLEELEPRSEIPVPRQRVVIRQSSIRVHDHTLQDVTIVEQSVTSPRLKNKKRPISAPPPKIRPPQEKSEEQVDLRSYSKSLKLLGLNIPSNRVEATQLTHQDLEIRTKSPTLKTRLTKRSQSISDLQELIDSKEKISKKEYVQIKKPLCKAVFEEWYFKKLQDELEKRRKEEEIKQEREYEEELEKEAKKERCSEEYKKWLMKKKLENNRLRKDRNAISSVKTGKTRRLLTEDQKKKMEDKLQEWKDTKMKELRKRKKFEEDKRKAKEEEELRMAQKKEAAASEFKAWRDKLNDQMRAKIKEERAKALEALEKKKEEAKEKKEAAEVSFIHWKKYKDEIREREINQRKQKRTKSARAGSNSESLRQKEAQIAYEKWLEYTEQREIEEKLAEEEQNLRYLWRPPWYPGGISEY